MSLRYPEGSQCQITYKTDELVLQGDYIVTTGGTGYKVASLHLVKTKVTDIRWPNHYRLTCLRCHPENIPAGARIHSLVWNNRNKK
jgi:hypothetical protein